MHFLRQRSVHDLRKHMTVYFEDLVEKTTWGINVGKYSDLWAKCLIVDPRALFPGSVTWLAKIYVRKFFCLDFVKMGRNINVRLKKDMNNAWWGFVSYQLKSVRSPNVICLSSKTSVNYYIWGKVCTCTTCMVAASKILSGYILDNKYCHYRHKL